MYVVRFQPIVTPGHADLRGQIARFLHKHNGGAPYFYAAYASHPCYVWLVGPQGPGYYWNYDRCPV